MANKEECKNKLNNLKKLQKLINENCNLNSVANSALIGSIECFENLIEEHFDNSPLKFEKLKEGMWIWDNYMKEWIKIERLKTVIISMNNYQYYIYVENNWGIPVEYEENRFYRKQVEE